MKKFDQLIYGARAVIETIQSGKHLEKLFIQKNNTSDLVKQLLTLTSEHVIPVSWVPGEKLNRLTKGNHQGVVAFVSPVQYHNLHHVVTNVFEEGKTPLFLALDGVTDIRNFGAIARTAECMGVDALIIPVKSNAQINADAVKTSAGALNYIPVCRDLKLLEALKYLKDSGIQVVACSEHGTISPAEVDFSVPTVIVMGSEEEGITREILKISDAISSIPMKGEISSLNVGSAAAMILYEATRQRI
ncbi:MAG: 23S rRNA (guanosine(2251)-2'-O)-methyltransferase RlmB [Cyclobacteriaceae bacterium]|nr:23S rRNA (guanosine(2251)-2'-O)-methyltransferase RlmB [Cyclobacteriaceae bacterium SS2]